MTPTGNGPRAFTLIELIVTMTIAAILAVTAIPAFIDMDQARLRRAAHELANHIEMARAMAMSTRRRTWIKFTPGSETYRVYIEDPDQAGRGNRQDLSHPVTGASTFEVSLDQDEFEGVLLDSASFGGQQEIEFDWLGKPYNGWGTALSSDGTVVLSADGNTRTVRVIAGTGRVQEE